MWKLIIEISYDLIDHIKVGISDNYVTLRCLFYVKNFRRKILGPRCLFLHKISFSTLTPIWNSLWRIVPNFTPSFTPTHILFASSPTYILSSVSSALSASSSVSYALFASSLSSLRALKLQGIIRNPWLHFCTKVLFYFDKP